MLRVQGVWRRDPALAFLAWWFKASVNLYVSTGPDDEGLPRHFDIFDTWIVQLYGEKVWWFDSSTRWSTAGEVWLQPAMAWHSCMAGPLGSVHLTFAPGARTPRARPLRAEGTEAGPRSPRALGLGAARRAAKSL